MESGVAIVARVRHRVVMPARPFVVVGAMNPCPCGYAGDPKRICGCTPDRVDRYRARISGPVLDRFDLHVPVARVPSRALRADRRGEPSSVVRGRVAAARERAGAALSGVSRLALEPLFEITDKDALALLDEAVERIGLSARAYVKVLRVARTIACLAASPSVRGEHVAEAIGLRAFDPASPPARGGSRLNDGTNGVTPWR
jgi:magnesium chelatase family protein